MIDTPVVHATALPYVTDESTSALLMVTRDLKVINDANMLPVQHQVFLGTNLPFLPTITSHDFAAAKHTHYAT